MRNTAIKVGLLFFALAFLSTNSVSAISSRQLALTEDPFHYKETALEQEAQLKKEQESKEKAEAKPVEDVKPTQVTPPPVTYVVNTGDSLTIIAETHQTDWKRLFNKNTQVVNPDALSIGEIITIPEADEQLAERSLPEPVLVVQTPQVTPLSGSTVYTQVRGNSTGNTYAPGYCTWYAKSRRPDLPNRLGNASAWVASAATQGFATGSAPRAGAIGQQGNHVVYVESVNGDGTVTVSEMNYRGLYIVSSRTTSASTFTYIY